MGRYIIGKGYSHPYGMSNNGIDAMSRGYRPYNRWSRELIIGELGKRVENWELPKILELYETDEKLINDFIEPTSVKHHVTQEDGQIEYEYFYKFSAKPIERYRRAFNEKFLNRYKDCGDLKLIDQRRHMHEYAQIISDNKAFDSGICKAMQATRASLLNQFPELASFCNEKLRCRHRYRKIVIYIERLKCRIWYFDDSRLISDLVWIEKTLGRKELWKLYSTYSGEKILLKELSPFEKQVLCSEPNEWGYFKYVPQRQNHLDIEDLRK